METQWLTRVRSFFKQVFSLLTNLQFQNGGPIIAWQIENEYGSVAEMGVKPDKQYLSTIKDYMVQLGASEMFFTSDNSGFGDRATGSLPGSMLFYIRIFPDRKYFKFLSRPCMGMRKRQ